MSPMPMPMRMHVHVHVYVYVYACAPLQRMVSVMIITKKQGMVKAASPAPSDECSRKICSGSRGAARVRCVGLQPPWRAVAASGACGVAGEAHLQRRRGGQSRHRGVCHPHASYLLPLLREADAAHDGGDDHLREELRVGAWLGVGARVGVGVRVGVRVRVRVAALHSQHKTQV